MQDVGMVEVTNISELFLSDEKNNLPGTAIGCNS